MTIGPRISDHCLIDRPTHLLAFGYRHPPAHGVRKLQGGTRPPAMDPKLTLLLPPLPEFPEGRPVQCPHCAGSHLARHGTRRKRITDTVLRQVSVQRYRCPRCRHTFRHYPAGVGRAGSSQRLVALLALLRSLGVSYTVIARVLEISAVEISPATVWRALQDTQVRSPPKPHRRLQVRALPLGGSPVESTGDIQLRFLRAPDGRTVVGVEVWCQLAQPFPLELVRFLEARGAVLVQDSC